MEKFIRTALLLLILHPFFACKTDFLGVGDTNPQEVTNGDELYSLKKSTKANLFQKQESKIGSDEYFVLQGYTIATIFSCTPSKVKIFLGLPTQNNKLSLGKFPELSRYYIISKGKVVGSISDKTKSLNQILTELYRNKNRRESNVAFGKQEFQMHWQSGILRSNSCATTIKEIDLSNKTQQLKERIQFETCLEEPQIKYSIQDAKGSHYVKNKWFSHTNEKLWIHRVWDVIDENNKKILYLIRAKSKDQMEFVFVGNINGKRRRIATIKQVQLQDVFPDLHRSLKKAPGRSEIWRIRKLPGLPIHPFLYPGLVAIKTEENFTEIRKAEKILRPVQKKKKRCRL